MMSAVCRARTLGLLTIRSGMDPRRVEERPERGRLATTLAAQRADRVRPVPLERVPGVGVPEQVDPVPIPVACPAARHGDSMPSAPVRGTG